MTKQHWLEGLNARQAVEEAAHEMRNHQMNLIGMCQLLQRMNMGDLDGTTLVPPLNQAEGLAQIQDSVRQLGIVMDDLLDYIREIEND